MKIPFNKPFIVGKELFYIAQSVIQNSQLAGDGPFTKKCQKWLETQFGCHKVLLTHSCTAALEMSAILCELKPGDEVIMPSFTFVSTANAFVRCDGTPVFIDIRQDTLNIDENLIEGAITEKTRAIVPVHYAGVPCKMDVINDIAAKYNLLVIEDAAQGFNSKYGNKFLGTIGNIGCLSFHETKNIISGEGGALLINDKKFIERAEIIWEKGTNRSKFFRGQVDKYTWVDIGSSFLPSDQIAAFLYAQLEESEKIINERRRIFNLYLQLLAALQEKEILRLPCMGNDCQANGHIFYIITKSLDERTKLIKYLKEREIYAVFHYIPLHSSPAGIKFGKTFGGMEITENISERLLRLPLFYGMTDKEVIRVSDSIKEFYSH
jgi:dTDP-4-amino-4,6-dideoxygalactose transaminase